MNEDDTAPQWHSTKAWSHDLKTKIEGVFGLSMERVFLSIERQLTPSALVCQPVAKGVEGRFLGFST
jgi:hypothetical protein